ncbi:ATP-binding protein [Nocardia asiatica]|uniref:ATP-binding protein n=1 Tax=Nocardia asiatica TaxID=209252 RepID=UPI0024546D1B|nr:ATP-binding protein [Nocardia asiatica]
MTRGLFCLSGVGTYNDKKNLKWVPNEIRTMRETLTGLGLRELFSFTEDERDHESLAHELKRWATEPVPEQDETLLIYCTGHGVHEDGRYTLALTNDEFEPRRLVAALGKRKGLRQVVVILDACFSEPGIDELLLEMRRANSTKTKIDFWGIGSSRRVEEAAQQAFAKHFAAAVERHSTASWTKSHLDLQQLVIEVNNALGKKQTVWLGSGHSAGNCLALPNPRHQSTTTPRELPMPADWVTKARGVSDASRPGFFFTGREIALEALRAHVQNDGAERALVVTGAKGAGKSALLGHFVMTATGVDALPVGARLRWPALQIEILACRGGRRTVVRSLAQGLGLAGQNLETVVSTLRERAEPIAIVLDELTENEEWDDVLAALTDVPSVRLVVSLARSSSIRVPTHSTLDLDPFGEYPDPDVREYLALRLALLDDVTDRYALAARWGLTFEVAVAAADSYENVSRQGGNRSTVDRVVMDAARAACRASVTDELGDRSGVVIDALWALCSYEDSVALPAREWAAAASDPSGSVVTPDEVASAAAHLDRFVEFRPSDTGLPRWRPRLCYEALPGDAQRRRRRTDVRNREQFLTRLPQLTAPRETDWHNTDPAVRKLIAIGASIQTPNGRLVDKPWFLLDLPPSIVQEAVRYLNGMDRQRRSLLMQAVRFRGARPDRALLLSIAAQRYRIQPVTSALAREEQAHDTGWVQPERPHLERLAGLMACSDTIAITVDTQDRLHFWEVVDGGETRAPTCVSGVPRTVSVASVSGEEIALVTTWQGEVWIIRCRGDDEPQQRPDLAQESAGPLSDLVAGLHPGGWAIIGAGRMLWATEFDTGRVRRSFDLDSDLHELHVTGPVDDPFVWCVTVAGRIRRLRLNHPNSPEVTPFPVPRSPLFAAVSPDGRCLVVVDVAGGLHLRRTHAGNGLQSDTAGQKVGAVAVNNRYAALAGAAPGGLGWLDLYDLDTAQPPIRSLLDEAPVGIALLEDRQVLVARPCGLLTLTPRATSTEPIPASTPGNRP